MLFMLRFDLRNPTFAGVTDAERYQAAVDMAGWADERGCLYASISEHHGSDDGYLPSPLPMAAAIAARTSNLRIGINALIAPFYDPIRLAEDAAVVDLLSGGRFDLTIAGGYLPHEFDHFGVPITKRPSLVCEAVEVLRQAWTGEPFEFRGRTVQVRPRPAQPGGPRITLGGSSEAAARRAALIADGFLPSENGCWEHYRDECLALGKPDPGAGMSIDADVVTLAEDPEAAWPVLAPYFLHEVNSYGAWQASATGINAIYRPVADIDELRATGQYRILTPDELATEMAEAELPVFRLHPMVGGIPPKLAWEALHLFEESFLQ